MNIKHVNLQNSTVHRPAIKKAIYMKNNTYELKPAELTLTQDNTKLVLKAG